MIPPEAEQVLNIIERCFAESLLAAYLHGSAVAGGLRPDSDVDVLAVIDRATTHVERAHLVSELSKISGRPGASFSRPIELTVFRHADLIVSAYPMHSEFVYGEWLRETFEAGEAPEPTADPEWTVLLAQARQEAKPLIGPHLAEFLPAIPQVCIRRAIAELLPRLLDTLEGDERNVLLTLVRMWRTLATGEFVTKDQAAEWAGSRLSASSAAVVDYARKAYLGTLKDDWQTRRHEVRQVADELNRRIAAMQ